jgi:hypothetical protein
LRGRDCKNQAKDEAREYFGDVHMILGENLED